MDELTPVEMEFCRFIMGRTGGFMSALFTAVAKADSVNLERLRLGFPDEVAAHERWTKGDLATVARNRFGKEKDHEEL